MDDGDIYGSILSDPKSTSNSNKYSDPYSEANLPMQQHPQSGQGQGQFALPPVSPQPSLFISNLTWWTSEDDLRHLLGDLSHRIKELQFLENKPNGKSKGMVIVEFVDVATAEAAKEMLEGREIDGRICEVSFARNPPVKPYERVVGARGDRQVPRQHYRLDQQYHQNQNQRQGYEIAYQSQAQTQPQIHHHQQQQYRDDYGHSHVSRHVHREDDNRGNDARYDNRHDNRSTSSSSKYHPRETRPRDDRSRSPDRRSSSKSRRY